MAALECDNAALIWLGDERGFLTDWVTQQWVRLTGRRVDLAQSSWLEGPIGRTRLIGKDFFVEYAASRGLEVIRQGERGLLQHFSALVGDSDYDEDVLKPVQEFYEETSEYEMDAWSDWHGAFRPFGIALGRLFSRRLQQLNVPISALDSSRGMTSEVLQLRDPSSGELHSTAWVRQLHATGNVLYSGSYSICHVPGYNGPCIKVVFPLPNGNAMVIMKPEVHSDGSFSVTSAGDCFGDPGFYFVVHSGSRVWAKFVRSIKETITVYGAEPGIVRADHSLWLWGALFLKLHYRMRRR